VPAYSNAFPPLSIAKGESGQVLNENGISTALPYSSSRVALLPGAGIHAQRVSAEVTFSAAPGAFSFQVQTADTDDAAHYVNEGSAISAVNASNVARIELNAVVAKFARITFTALTNNVTVTATLSA
jgi:hypothetical protein